MPGAKDKQSDSERLAGLCHEQRLSLLNAGRRLHDDVGPLLSAAGLKLQLLSMDVPQAGEAARETIQLLDEAFEHVRSLSQEFLASPAYRGGLRNALERLSERHPEILLEYGAAAQAPPEAGAAIYDVAVAAVEAALKRGARSIGIHVTGNASLTVRISDDGRSARRDPSLALVTKLAAPARVKVEFPTKRDRIVLIRYALRRPTRG